MKNVPCFTPAEPTVAGFLSLTWVRDRQIIRWDGTCIVKCPRVFGPHNTTIVIPARDDSALSDLETVRRINSEDCNLQSLFLLPKIILDALEPRALGY
jgi:hypothetical protein